MATSRCGKCNSTSFEAKDVLISNYNFPLAFIQCASCGTVINTVEHNHISELLIETKLKIDGVAGYIASLEKEITSLKKKK